MRNAFADEVTNLAAEDNNIILISGDIGNRLFDKLREKTPKQFLNCGIAEGSMMSVAAGMGLCGLKPIVYTIAPFTTARCLEQIRLDVAYHNSPVIIVGVGAGLSYASLGPTHHSLEDFAILRAIPNIQILAPWDANSLRVCLRQALNTNLPTYIRIGKKGEKELTLISDVPKIGSTHTVFHGNDLCIIATGTIAQEAIHVGTKLNDLGYSTELVLLHTIKPLSDKTIGYYIKKFNYIFIIEEHALIGGLGQFCEALNSRMEKRTNIKIFGTADYFLKKVGSHEYAKKEFHLNQESLLNEIIKFIK